jgi:hypothetical protein
VFYQGNYIPSFLGLSIVLADSPALFRSLFEHLWWQRKWKRYFESPPFELESGRGLNFTAFNQT